MTSAILFKDIDQPGLNTIAVYKQRGGYGDVLRRGLQMPREALVTELVASGLRGRGGAGFSMGKKASFMPKGTMDKYLVCNADESEPGTFKDRELMTKSPHMLIEGMILAAYAAGATRSFIYIRGEYAQQADILDAAVAEAYADGLLGNNILGSDHSLELVVHRGAGAYICGEETALLDSLEGKRGTPRLKPPFPANQGLYQGPTLINNVETLATIPHILEMGAAEYAEIGVENSTGTKLISVSGHVKRPGNYEIELGMSARDIIYGLCGGIEGDHEVKLANLAYESGKPVILVFNKWDLVADEDLKSLEKELDRKLAHLEFAPRVYTSAINDYGIHELLAEATKLYTLWQMRIGTSEMNRWLEVWQMRQAVPNFGGKPLRMYFMTQAEIAPPTFVIFCNRSAFVTRAYENFLRNRMREDLGLPGVPVRIVWREKGPWKRKAERDADRASEAAALEAPAKGSRKERREAKLAEDAKSA